MWCVCHVKLQGISGLFFSTTWLLHVWWCHFVQSCATLCIHIQFAVMVLPCNLHVLLCAALDRPLCAVLDNSTLLSAVLDHLVQCWTTLQFTSFFLSVQILPCQWTYQSGQYPAFGWGGSYLSQGGPFQTSLCEHQRGWPSGGSTSILPGEIL